MKNTANLGHDEIKKIIMKKTYCYLENNFEKVYSNTFNSTRNPLTINAYMICISLKLVKIILIIKTDSIEDESRDKGTIKPMNTGQTR